MASKKSNNAGFGPAQRYKALWDYKRRKNDELSFAKGEILVATLASEAYWLVATNRQGQCGLIPENYVRPVKIKPKKEEKQQIHSNSAVGTAGGTVGSAAVSAAGGTAGSAAVSAAVTAANDSNKPPSKEDADELLSKTPSILQIEDWEQRVASIMKKNKVPANPKASSGSSVPYKRAVHPKHRPKRPWSDQLDSNSSSPRSPRSPPPSQPRIMSCDISRLRICLPSGDLVPLRPYQKEGILAFRNGTDKDDVMFEIIDGQLTYRTNEETSLPVVLVTEPQVMPLTPAKTPSTKPMMGWLQKLTRRGLLKQNQHQRFFILKGSTLEYYKSEKCKHLRGKININRDCSVRFLDKPNSFEVTYHPPSSSNNSPRVAQFQLIAPDLDNCRAWINAIQKRIEWDLASANPAAANPEATGSLFIERNPVNK